MAAIHFGDKSVEAVFQSGMWRASIAGKSFCGATLESLIRAVSSVYPVTAPREKPPEDTRSQAEILCSIVRNPESKLAEKQYALGRLFDYAARGDGGALALARELQDKPPISYNAQAITNLLNKPDFVFVTHEELVEHVKDLVVRSWLYNELSRRITFKRENEY